MVIISAVLAMVFSLFLVVGIHESGHALVAHLCKIKIKIISIGFGKALFRWRSSSGSQWVWALWPAGGYVQLLNTRISPVIPADLPYAFDKKPLWMRCCVLLSGAFANIIMAWLAIMIILMLGTQVHSPVVAKVFSPSILNTAGLEKGDRINSINNRVITSWRDVAMQLLLSSGDKDVKLVVSTPSGEQHYLSADLTHWKEHYQGNFLTSLGIYPDSSSQNKLFIPGLTILSAGQQAFIQLVDLSYFYLVLLVKLLTGAIPFIILLGPITVLTAMTGTFLQGTVIFLYFIANLSISVALVNLLPIPGLDGGSVMYALIEKIRGKPISIAMEVLLQQLAFIAFCLLMVQLLLNDAHRYFAIYHG